MKFAMSQPKVVRRSGVVIYQILTGVTSNVGVPSTHLVFNWTLRNKLQWNSNQYTTLQWRHTERDGVSNHQPDDCLLNRLCRHRTKKTSKLCVTDLCEGNSRVTGEFPTQRASNAENVFSWWRHMILLIHINALENVVCRIAAILLGGGAN